MADRGERWARGLDAYSSQLQIPRAEIFDHMCSLVGERMATEAINAGGGAWPEEGPLSLRDRSLIVLAVLATQGGVESRMRPHVRWAIEHGATAEELEEMAALLAVYIGYPRASVAMELIRERPEGVE